MSALFPDVYCAIEAYERLRPVIEGHGSKSLNPDVPPQSKKTVLRDYKGDVRALRASVASHLKGLSQAELDMVIGGLFCTEKALHRFLRKRHPKIFSQIGVRATGRRYHKMMTNLGMRMLESGSIGEGRPLIEQVDYTSYRPPFSAILRADMDNENLVIVAECTIRGMAEPISIEAPSCELVIKKMKARAQKGP